MQKYTQGQTDSLRCSENTPVVQYVVQMETVNYFWNMIVITSIQEYTSKINKYNYVQSSKEVVGKKNTQTKNLWNVEWGSYLRHKIKNHCSQERFLWNKRKRNHYSWEILVTIYFFKLLDSLNIVWVTEWVYLGISMEMIFRLHFSKE